MKLTPQQVRFVYPFLPGIFGRSLRFAGRRNTVHAQETALVVEGELLRFGFVGLERLVPRALAEWTTVTIPYGRILRVKYQSRRVVRTLGTLLLVLVLGASAAAMLTTLSAAESLVFFVPLSLIVLLLGWLLFRVLSPGFAITFRAKDGTRTRFLLQVRNRTLRQRFAAQVEEYRAAAKAFAIPSEGSRP